MSSLRDQLRDKLNEESYAILLERLTDVLKSKALLIDALFTYSSEDELQAIFEELYDLNGNTPSQREKLIKDLEASLCARTGGHQ